MNYRKGKESKLGEDDDEGDLFVHSDDGVGDGGFYTTVVCE